MKIKILAIILLLLLIFSSFGALGFDTEVEPLDACGCRQVEYFQENENSGYFLGELPNEEPLPPGNVVAGMAPDSWDWRSATYNGKTGDWTTSIKNQENCGSCYAFGALAAMESCLKIKSSNPNLNIDLSEQFMVSCGLEWQEGMNGCYGAIPSATFSFLEQYGAIPESCFPYVSGGGNVPSCLNKCANWQELVIDVKDCGNIQATQESIKNAIIQYGPVSASFEVYTDFYDYDGGVYVHNYGGYEGLHRIAMVGYNDNPGYWICKNFWGDDWGDEGWFYIAYGQCSIEAVVYYVEVDTYLTEIYRYGKDFDVISGTDWSIEGHTLRMSIGGGEVIATYEIDIGTDEIQDGSLAAGIYFKDVSWWGDGPDLKIYNFNTGSWQAWSHVGNWDIYTWFWGENLPGNDNDYVSNNKIVKLQVRADGNDETYLDTLGVRYIPVFHYPNLDASSSPNPLSWYDVQPSETRTGTITVKNIGDSGSYLAWKVDDCPSWVTCSKTSGSNIPKDGTDTFTITVTSSNNGNDERSGKIRLENSEDPNDYKEFDITIKTKKGRGRALNLEFLKVLVERFQIFLKLFLTIKG